MSMNSTTITPEERDLLEHTVGTYQAENPYRNHYFAGPGHHAIVILQSLCQKGMMRERITSLSDNNLFYATDAGFQAIGLSGRDAITD